MRDLLLGLGEPGGDGLAHAVEGDLLIVAVGIERGDLACVGARGRRGGRGLRRGFGCGGFRGAGGFDIGLDDAAARARAGDLGKIDAPVGGDAPGQRRGEDAGAVATLSGRGGGCLGAPCGRRLGIRVGRPGRLRRRARGGLGNVVFAFVLTQKHRDRGVDLDPGAALGDQQLADHALVDRFEFHRRLVGLDLGQQVARGHAVAFLDQPFRQRAFFHRRAEGGHQDFGGHGVVSGHGTGGAGGQGRSEGPAPSRSPRYFQTEEGIRVMVSKGGFGRWPRASLVMAVSISCLWPAIQT